MNKDCKEEVVAQFLAVPQVGRKSLQGYLKSIGLEASDSYYQLARNPKVIRKALQIIGLRTFKELPDVMQALVDGAKAGNVRAADVLLKHVRELSILGHSEEKTNNLNRLLEDTAKIASDLDKLADSIERGEKIRKERKIEDVDSRDIEDITDSMQADLILDAPPGGVQPPDAATTSPPPPPVSPAADA